MNRCGRGEKSNVKRRKRIRRDLHCIVHFLDNTLQLFRLNAKDDAEVLLRHTFHHLGVVEPKYFGLSFLDVSAVRSQRWLEPDKSLHHQLKCSKGEVHFRFEVKFYVENPSQLDEAQTRNFFFLQCWKNVVNGLLIPSPQTTCLLTSYYLQTKIASGSGAEEVAEILKMEELPKIAKENLTVISELGQLLKDQTVDQAQTNFLDHIRRLEFYGVDLHPAEDCNGKKIEVGISSRFVSVYRRNQRINGFSWCKIVRIFYKRKRFFLQLQRERFEDYDTVVGFRLSTKRAAKMLWKSCMEQHSFFRLGQAPPASHVTKGVFPVLRKLLSIKSCYTVTGAQSSVHRKKPQTKSGSRNAAKNHQTTTNKATYRRYDNLHKIQSSFTSSPRPAWSSAPDIHVGSGGGSMESGSDMKNGLDDPSIDSPSPVTAFIPSDIHQGICFADEEGEDEFRLPLYLEPDYDSIKSPVSDEYEVHLTADNSGLFGFNIRFQNALHASAFISRIIPNGPADMCYPPMRIGDELLAINGHPIDSLTQGDVIELFRAARHSSLALFLRRSASWCSSEVNEQPLEYVFDGSGTQLTAEDSVAVIADGLRSGRLLSQYELLPRSRLELSCSVAKHDDNIRKNRYGDIFPYDCNRVLLQSPFGDYINASHVSMPLPGKNNVLHYIATQGPLPHTVEDFWSVVWRQGVPLIAMVTPESERGLIKCHRYWPDIGEIVRVGDLVICCQSQQHFGHFVHNEFMLTDAQTGEYRCLDHVQYLDWPDHGVPVSATHFLDYVRFTRSLLTDDDKPILVHCSAGIGRTGAFILLDVALCLIQAGQTVNPIALVKTMRDQRPMMVQTSMQFQYVCECIMDSLQ